MAGIRPPDNAAPAAPPESTEGKLCTLFVLCSQYVLSWGIKAVPVDTDWYYPTHLADFSTFSSFARNDFKHAALQPVVCKKT
jgi:hypothetical protein